MEKEEIRLNVQKELILAMKSSNIEETVKDQYKKYCKAIESCDEAELVPNFEKFTKFLKENTDDSESGKNLFVTLRMGSIAEAVMQVVKRHTVLKKYAFDWSATTMNKCYKLIDSINDIDELPQYASSDTSQYKIQFYRLCELASSQEDACMSLAIWNEFRRADPHRFNKWLTEAKELLAI